MARHAASLQIARLRGKCDNCACVAQNVQTTLRSDRPFVLGRPSSDGVGRERRDRYSRYYIDFQEDPYGRPNYKAYSRRS